MVLFHDFVSMMGNESTGTCGIFLFISLSLDRMLLLSFLSFLVFVFFGFTFLFHLKFFMRIIYCFKGYEIPFSQFDYITEKIFTFIISFT